MFTWIDILIVGIILVCMIWGTFRGLVKSIFSIITIICSFIIAKLFSGTLSTWLINNTRIEDTIHTFLRVNNVIPESVSNSVEQGSTNVADWFAGLNLGDIPSSIIHFFENLWNSGSNAVSSGGNMAVDALTASIVSFISFVGILILAYVVLSLIVEILNLATKLPVIRTFNKLGGALFGIVKGLIINLILISIIFVVAIFLKDSSLNVALRDSMFASYFYIGYILF
ncbi:CvpA family protein [Anaerofustis sp. HA2171]|uniref:CvpA family protein n=1 Tax=Anaerofustis butyriciformans TaxID=3108533 RepID=UPI002E2F5BB2|nr:CvpA family protein [Anaerofustis sp. HA2171]